MNTTPDARLKRRGSVPDLSPSSKFIHDPTGLLRRVNILIHIYICMYHRKLKSLVLLHSQGFFNVVVHVHSVDDFPHSI